MLGFDEENLEVADGSAGDAGEQVRGAASQLLEEVVGIVIAHKLGGIEALLRRSLNRVVVHENACDFLAWPIHTVGGHA